MMQVQYHSTTKYSIPYTRRVSNKRTLCKCASIYFQEKCNPVRPYSIAVNSTMTALRNYVIFEKIPCPVRLFHTVLLLDS